MIGMLWFDNSAATLEKKVEKAAAYYQGKYGKTARVVMVNPADGAEGTLAGVTVKTSTQVLRNHLWVGEAQA